MLLPVTPAIIRAFQDPARPMPPGTYAGPWVERDWMLADYVAAGRPLTAASDGKAAIWAPGGLVHLFPEIGVLSLCEVLAWTSAVKAAETGSLTWLCTRCQAVAVAALVGQAICPACRAPLADPSCSPGGWSHCRRCRRGWLVEGESVIGRDWPAREAVA